MINQPDTKMQVEDVDTDILFRFASLEQENAAMWRKQAIYKAIAEAARAYLKDQCANTRNHLSYLLAKE